MAAVRIGFRVETSTDLLPGYPSLITRRVPEYSLCVQWISSLSNAARLPTSTFFLYFEREIKNKYVSTSIVINTGYSSDIYPSPSTRVLVSTLIGLQQFLLNKMFDLYRKSWKLCSCSCCIAYEYVVNFERGAWDTGASKIVNVEMLCLHNNFTFQTNYSWARWPRLSDQGV